MKNNIKKLLILFISIFALPFIVYADMGAPESYNYDVIITNPKGAPLYTEEGKKTNTTIDFDTKITISYERLIKGELYLEYYSEEDEKYGYIKFSDVKLFDEEIDFSRLYENKDKEQYYSYEETKMYKGPSAVYGEIKDVTIPEGTIIDYTHEAGDMWIYTEYKGTKGWVYIYDYNDIFPQAPKKTVAYVYNDSRVLILGDQKVYNNKGEEIGKVKSLTKYDVLYRSGSRKDIGELYIKGKDIEGWVKETGRFGADGAHFITEDVYKSIIIERNGLPLFNDPELQEVNNITIPCGTEISTKYPIYLSTEGDISSEIEYKGKKYWINVGFEKVAEENEVKIEGLVNSKTLYKYGNTDESLNIEIPAGENLVSKYSFIEDTGEEDANGPIYNNWYYVEYEGTEGWIYISDNEQAENPTVIIPEEDEEEEEPSEDEEEEEDEEESQKPSPTQIAIVSVCVAVFLAVGALTTLLLINKKKKEKTTPEATEVVVEHPVVEEEALEENPVTEEEQVTEEEPVVEEPKSEETSKVEETKTQDKKTKNKK